MKKYKHKKTKDIWYANDRQHILYFDSNPNFVEVKEEKKPVQKKEEAFSNTNENN